MSITQFMVAKSGVAPGSKRQLTDIERAPDDCAPIPKATRRESLLSDLLTEDSWRELMDQESKKPYFAQLEAFLKKEMDSKTVYPPTQQILRALNELPVSKVKAVIIGQDPYHGAGQAEGLCFSVPKGQKVPSSLQNIYKELKSDVGFQIPKHGNLAAWVEQGVLLLNTSLTVEEKKAGSHAKKGWERFTDAVIAHVSKQQKGLVFMLWGKHAQTRKSAIHSNNHSVLETVHPSGLSAHRGFFGCKHFSKCNQLLEKQGVDSIDWTISM